MTRSLLMFILPVGLLACASPHPEEAAVLTALDATVDALQRSDFDALWDLTDPDTQRALLDLLTHVHEAMALVPEVYPDEARQVEARKALGEPLLGSIFAGEERAGPRLVSRLLSTERLRRDQGAMDGVSHRDVTVATAVQPLRAVVHTSAGESFAFVKSERGWRSLLLRDLVLDSLAIKELQDNATKLKQAHAARTEAWRESRDPRTPQGAYNLARAAVTASPRDVGLLYALLDAEARAVLVRALEASREAQRAVQRRTTRKQRKRAYADAGLSLYVDATSDRELYERWAATEAWISPLPATDPPKAIEGDPSSGAVTVITDSGAAVPMVRDDGGYWHLANQAPTLDKALLDPIRGRLKP